MSPNGLKEAEKVVLVTLTLVIVTGIGKLGKIDEDLYDALNHFLLKAMFDLIAQILSLL